MRAHAGTQAPSHTQTYEKLRAGSGRCAHTRSQRARGRSAAARGTTALRDISAVARNDVLGHLVFLGCGVLVQKRADRRVVGCLLTVGNGHETDQSTEETQITGAIARTKVEGGGR